MRRDPAQAVQMLDMLLEFSGEVGGRRAISARLTSYARNNHAIGRWSESSRPVKRPRKPVKTGPPGWKQPNRPRRSALASPGRHFDALVMIVVAQPSSARRVAHR